MGPKKKETFHSSSRGCGTAIHPSAHQGEPSSSRVDVQENVLSNWSLLPSVTFGETCFQPFFPSQLKTHLEFEVSAQDLRLCLPHVLHSHLSVLRRKNNTSQQSLERVTRSFSQSNTEGQTLHATSLQSYRSKPQTSIMCCMKDTSLQKSSEMSFFIKSMRILSSSTMQCSGQPWIQVLPLSLTSNICWDKSSLARYVFSLIRWG